MKQLRNETSFRIIIQNVYVLLSVKGLLFNGKRSWIEFSSQICVVTICSIRVWAMSIVVDTNRNGIVFGTRIVVG